MAEQKRSVNDNEGEVPARALPQHPFRVKEKARPWKWSVFWHCSAREIITNCSF